MLTTGLVNSKRVLSQLPACIQGPDMGKCRPPTVSGVTRGLSQGGGIF